MRFRLSDETVWASEFTAAGPGTWEREHHTVFSEKNEAVAEGIRRLVRICPAREGWINEEAHRRFGYGALR